MVCGKECEDERLSMIPLQIAIDGPVAAGKGDIAGRLAKELGLLYIYTGAMYRMLALACIEKNILPKDPEKVFSLLSIVSIELVDPDPNSQNLYKALLDGVDVTERITEQDAAMGASDVSTIAEVRQFMVKRQQDIARGHRVVMEGRDIGLRVLPNAQLKIFLTATLEERARRRWEQNKLKRINQSLEEVIEDTKKRDFQDMNRAVDPLRKLPDSWELDTTSLTQPEVIEKIKEELRRRRLL